MKTDQAISNKALLGAAMIGSACILRSFTVRDMFSSFGTMTGRIGLMCLLACVYHYGARFWLDEVKLPVKKKRVAIWLSVLGGPLGLDRLYLGDRRSTALKFLTFGGLGIWWICDIAMIACGLLRPLDGTDYDTDEKKPAVQPAQKREPQYTVAPASRKRDPIKALSDLHELHQKGILSDEEYARKRSEYVKLL